GRVAAHPGHPTRGGRLSTSSPSPGPAAPLTCCGGRAVYAAAGPPGGPDAGGAPVLVAAGAPPTAAIPAVLLLPDREVDNQLRRLAGRCSHYADQRGVALVGHDTELNARTELTGQDT